LPLQLSTVYQRLPEKISSGSFQVEQMTEQQREELRRFLAERANFHRTHPAEARAFLLTTGIYTKDGKLAPEYDGDEQTSAHPE